VTTTTMRTMKTTTLPSPSAVDTEKVAAAIAAVRFADVDVGDSLDDAVDDELAGELH